MTSQSFWSHVLHVIAGVIVVAVPMALADIPQSWQALTIGGFLMLIFSVSKSYLEEVTS